MMGEAPLAVTAIFELELHISGSGQFLYIPVERVQQTGGAIGFEKGPC